MFRRIQARHYKMLRYVDVRLEGMNILVGPNASGKSTLLDVFSFLQAALRDDVEKAVRDRGRTLSELVWQGQDVQEGFEFAVEVDLPDVIAPGGKFKRVRYELNVGLDDDGSIAIRAESLLLLSAGSESTAPRQRSIVPLETEDKGRITRAPGNQFPSGSRKVVSRSAEGTSTYAAETKDWNTQFRLNKLRLSLSGVPEDEARFPVALWFRRMLLDSIQIVQLNSTLMGRPTPSDAQRSFQTDGSNLPIVVAELQRTHPERFQWWVDHVRTLLPDLEGVYIQERESDRSLFLQLRYTNGLLVPAWLLSDGTLRMLALTLIAYIRPEQQAIYLIEEPENGVHPKAIEGIFDSLDSMYDGQVFLATHSPLLVAKAKPDHLLIFSKSEQGSAIIVRGSDHLMLENWKHDLSLGSLFAAGVFE